MSAMSAAVSTAVLKNVPLLASFPDEQLRVLTAVVNRRSVARGSGRELRATYIYGVIETCHAARR